MTPELEKVCEEAWEVFKENNDPVGQAKLYYKDNGEYFKKGFKAAIESEQVKGLVEVIRGLIDDLETPHRLGVGGPVNPDWVNYNKAKQALEKFRGGDE